MIFDLHVHTTFSPCSRLTVDQLLSQAKALGLDGICITDHDTMAVRNRLQEGLQDNGLCVIVGMEYTTGEGDFLLFGPFENLPPGMPARRLLAMVDQEGGVAIAAHPFRTLRKTTEDLITGGLCRIIEGINGRNLDHENSAALSLAGRHRVQMVNGSDAHSAAELGRARTILHGTVRNRADLIACLKEQAFSAADEANADSLSLADNY
jgi:hypothetical protein